MTKYAAFVFEFEDKDSKKFVRTLAKRGILKDEGVMGDSYYVNHANSLKSKFPNIEEDSQLWTLLNSANGKGPMYFLRLEVKNLFILEKSIEQFKTKGERVCGEQRFGYEFDCVIYDRNQ